jgi:CRP-like cAMP-binding protein
MHNKLLIDFFTANGLVSQSSAITIAAEFSPAAFAKNHFLIKEGKICDDYFLLQKGFMRAFAIDTEGRDITTGFYSPGQVVFEVSSFFTRSPCKENIQALVDCEGWQINYEGLNKLFHAMPEFREFGRAILVKGYAALKNRMLGMITETAEQRYSQLLQMKPEIFQQASLKHIATYLGITDTSLSRIRKEMAGK